MERGPRHARGVLAALALLLGLLPGGPVFASTVQAVEIGDDAVVIRFDAAVAKAASFVVDHPQRIAIDVDGATPGPKATAAGLVAQVRQGARAGGTRIVLDLAEPALVSNGRFDESGTVLTLALGSVSAARFAAAARVAPFDIWPFNRTAKDGLGGSRYKVTQAVPPPARALPLPEVQGDDSRPLVVIDAGHGGVDPGAINRDTGLREKDVTLKVAQAIRDRLLASGRVRVALTRDGDRYLVLRERYGIARRLKADLFISIHCDSTGSEDATGASVYTLSEVASDKEAARLAARENKADVISGVDLGDAGADVSSILIDLTQRETMNASAGFARLLGREARPLMPLKANFHRMASLMVLKAPDMPSILFETGYISNPADAAFLDSREGREKIAESVSRAVGVHFARRLAMR